MSEKTVTMFVGKVATRDDLASLVSQSDKLEGLCRHIVRGRYGADAAALEWSRRGIMYKITARFEVAE